MYIMTQESNKKLVIDIATTRLFSVHAYLVEGEGSIKVSQSNFNKPDRFEVIDTIQLLTTSDSARNAIISVKDAPCKYFQVELVDPDEECQIEVEILFK
jgi:hypothetical protein